MSAETVVFNGIDGTTGNYLRAPVRIARRTGRGQTRKGQRKLRVRGLKSGVDCRDLRQTGWGVIFSHDEDEEVAKALSVLLDHRKREAGGRYRVLIYRRPESKSQFLERYRVGPGPVDPSKLPYYLLVVGDPEKIPYSFQYQLDVQYAVGRISFDDPECYRNYAASVVDAETIPSSRGSREAVFFGPEHPEDEATRLSAKYLVRQLSEQIEETHSLWDVRKLVHDEASKSRLTRVLGGEETPALLFTAGHGLGFDAGHPSQLEFQGAFLCQEWPGPTAPPEKRIPGEDQIFSAGDVGDDARLQGLVSFHFACHSAGTPSRDSFSHLVSGTREVIAEHDFVARLPQRLLGHPRGGALAVIGHVDTAWQSSFLWKGTGSQLQTFESALSDLMDGLPVGAAMESFGQRYAELATLVSAEIELAGGAGNAGDLDLEATWRAQNDARGYVVLGDPAVRLALDNGSGSQPVACRGSNASARWQS